MPFVISNVMNECTEYTLPISLKQQKNVYIQQKPFVGDDGIYVPVNEYVTQGTSTEYRCILTRDMFVEAYNKWIKDAENESN